MTWLAMLLTPLGRLAAMGALLALALGWGGLERVARHSAQARADAAGAALAGCEARIRNMEVRRDAEDAATRDPDPAGSLRGWHRD